MPDDVSYYCREKWRGSRTRNYATLDEAREVHRRLNADGWNIWQLIEQRPGQFEGEPPNDRVLHDGG